MELKKFEVLRNDRFLVVMISLLYLGLISVLKGLKIEHYLLISIFIFLYLYSKRTRKFILAFSIFLVFGILYDLMNSFPNYLVNQVDISSINNFEREIFGVTINGQTITLNEYFEHHNNALLDILCGLFYINWIPVPIAFAAYLYLRDKRQFIHFSLTFFIVNIIGFVIYYIHPAAPPWYVNLYGFDFIHNVPGNTGGLSRFDSLVNLPVFDSIYSRNSNVFAALPSLHSAYPVVVFYYAINNKLGCINWLLAFFMAGIWFSAVYTNHHYVTDVFAGILCAIAGILLFQKFLLNIGLVKNLISRYAQVIT